MAEDELQLLTFCTSSVELYAQSIIDPAAVNLGAVQKEIQSFVSKLNKSEATKVAKILFCLELQYRNAAMYECFLTTKKNIEDFNEAIRKAASTVGAEGSSANVSDYRNHSYIHGELTTQALNLLKYYTSCFPIRHRVRSAPCPLSISPICSYKMDDFEINAKAEYFLLEKLDQKWKVQARDQEHDANPVGPVMLIPSVFFFINWVSDDAQVIQRLYTRSREALCAYIVALSARFREETQQSNFKSSISAAELKQIKSLVLPIPEDPDNVTKSMIIAMHEELGRYLERTKDQFAVESDDQIQAILNSILTAVQAYLAIPESVPDRSNMVLNRRLRITDNETNNNGDKKLVQVEWRMQLTLNKSVTTTETTEIIPKHIDVDTFTQSEQELERKMVIQAVVDPATDTEISLNEAVKLGIINYSTGSYNNPGKGESMTIDEAIMRGLILVEFVATKAGVEKLKSFGTITVEDATQANPLFFLIHDVLSRKSGLRLDFNTAVEMEILNAEYGTYLDELEDTPMSIQDALEKGYITGRKLKDHQELEEVTKH